MSTLQHNFVKFFYRQIAPLAGLLNIARKPIFVVSDQVLHKLGYSVRRKFGFRKLRDCSINIARTKALISCAAMVQLICTFVNAYAKSRFFHDVAQLISIRE